MLYFGRRNFSRYLIQKLSKYIHNYHFLSSSSIRLCYSLSFDDDNCIYDPNTSVLQLKHDTMSYMDTIIGTKNPETSKYEVEMLFKCIKKNKTKDLRSLMIYVYYKKQLLKLINFITTGKIPKLKEFIITITRPISDEQINVYRKQLNDSSFIQENHFSSIICLPPLPSFYSSHTSSLLLLIPFFLLPYFPSLSSFSPLSV
ncbi:hypothetical protein WA158_006570 [Blastocystis sp. Blastoise]